MYEMMNGGFSIGRFLSMKGAGHKMTLPLRKVLNAMFYVVRIGCQGHELLSDFPKWQSVYCHYARWMCLGIWRRASPRGTCAGANRKPAVKSSFHAPCCLMMQIPKIPPVRLTPAGLEGTLLPSGRCRRLEGFPSGKASPAISQLRGFLWPDHAFSLAQIKELGKACRM